jgi:PIN domain nuclease of toxin-antitoxin system
VSLYLLDTHVALWALAEPDRLRPNVRAALVDPGNVVMVSAATVWEVEIKRSLGKLRAPDGFADECLARGFTPRLVTFADAIRAASLPAVLRDPFDRMLIGQALEDDATIVTVDRLIGRYNVKVMAGI